MKYYTLLLKLNVFTLEDLNVEINDIKKAMNILYTYKKKGILKSIKKNLYTIVRLEDKSYANKFDIASKITQSSFISHHSAFEFFGFYNQVYNEVNVSTISKFNSFEFDGNYYKQKLTSNVLLVDTIKGVRVSTIERTIVDCINGCGKVIEFDELITCINLIPFIVEEDILKYLEYINNKILYKKVGYVLSNFKEKKFITDAFFLKCLNNSNNVVGSFSSNKNSLVYNKVWKLYVPDYNF